MESRKRLQEGTEETSASSGENPCDANQGSKGLANTSRAVEAAMRDVIDTGGSSAHVPPDFVHETAVQLENDLNKAKAAAKVANEKHAIWRKIQAAQQPRYYLQHRHSEYIDTEIHRYNDILNT
jgi:hypothetical protein